MNKENQFDNIEFILPKNQSNVIKVIGIGGGGSNAINYMYNKGIKGVDYVVCNTDSQALENSPVPNKVQLGIKETEGLGAGADPVVGEKAAIESLNEMRGLLEKNTKMVFILLVWEGEPELAQLQLFQNWLWKWIFSPLAL